MQALNETQQTAINEAIEDLKNNYDTTKNFVARQMPHLQFCMSPALLTVLKFAINQVMEVSEKEQHSDFDAQAKQEGLELIHLVDYLLAYEPMPTFVPQE